MAFVMIKVRLGRSCDSDGLFMGSAGLVRAQATAGSTEGGPGSTDIWMCFVGKCR